MINGKDENIVKNNDNTLNNISKKSSIEDISMKKALSNIKITFILSIITILISLISLLTTSVSKIDIYYIIYIGAFIIASVLLITKKSRIAAIALFLNYLISRIGENNRENAIVSLIFIVLYFKGILGTFSYHKIKTGDSIMKKVVLIIVAVVIVLFLIGIREYYSKELYETDYFNITMREGLKIVSDSENTVTIGSNDMVLIASKVSFEDIKANIKNFENDYSITEYINLIENINNVKYDFKIDNDIVYQELKEENDGHKLFTMEVILKSKDAFWHFTFTCDNFEKTIYDNLFIKWAKNVEFK